MADAASTVSDLVRLATERIAASGSGSARLDAELLLGQTLGDGPDRHPRPPGRPRRGGRAPGVRGRRRAARAWRAGRLHPRLPGVPRARLRDRLARPDPASRDGAARRRRAGRGQRAACRQRPGPTGRPRSGSSTSGTGTGAIAISLLAALRRRKMDEQVLVIAVDVSAEALQLARENAVGHGVADRMVFVAADLLPYHVEPPYAVVCANLPYVPTGRAAAPVARDRVRADLRARRRSGRPRRGAPPDRPPAFGHGSGRGRVARDRRGPGRRDRAGGRGADPERALHGDAGPGGSPEARADRPVAGVSQRAQPERMDGLPAGDRPSPAFPVRLIALDLDGTVIGPDFRISDRTAAAIRDAVSRGVHVSIATGRMASSAAVYAHHLGLTDPIIGHQGAVIRAMPSAPTAIDPADPPFRAPVGRILRHTPMAAEAAREAIAWCLERGLDPHVNDLERIVVWRGDARFEDYSGYLGPEADIVGDLAASVRKPVSKVIAVGGPAAADGADRGGAADVRRARRRHRLPPPVPRVRRAGRVEGPGGRLAGEAGRDPDGPGDDRRRRAERHRDDRRRRARGGDGRRRRRSCARPGGTSPRRSRRTASAR